MPITPHAMCSRKYINSMTTHTPKPKDLSTTSSGHFRTNRVISKLTRTEFKIFICNTQLLFQSMLTKSVVFKLWFLQETICCYLNQLLYRILKHKAHKTSFAPGKVTLLHWLDVHQPQSQHSCKQCHTTPHTWKVSLLPSLSSSSACDGIHIVWQTRWE